MKARPRGFELTFTHPIDPAIALDLSSYAMKSYTYEYHSAYGSDEIDTQPVEIASVITDEENRKIYLECKNLKTGYVYELQMKGLRSIEGHSLLHDTGYYTLNKIPGD